MAEANESRGMSPGQRWLMRVGAGEVAALAVEGWFVALNRPLEQWQRVGVLVLCPLAIILFVALTWRSTLGAPPDPQGSSAPEHDPPEQSRMSWAEALFGWGLAAAFGLLALAALARIPANLRTVWN